MDFEREYKKAKRELTLYLSILKEVDSLAELLLRYDNSSKLVAMKYKFDKCDSKIKTDLSDPIAQMEKIKTRYQKRLRDCFIHLELVQEKIDKIEEPNFRNILRRKYLQGQEFKVIASELGILTVNTVRKMHKKALKCYTEVDI